MGPRGRMKKAASPRRGKGKASPKVFSPPPIEEGTTMTLDQYVGASSAASWTPEPAARPVPQAARPAVLLRRGSFTMLCGVWFVCLVLSVL